MHSVTREAPANERVNWPMAVVIIAVCSVIAWIIAWRLVRLLLAW